MEFRYKALCLCNSNNEIPPQNKKIIPQSANAVLNEYRSDIQPMIGPNIEKINLLTRLVTDSTVALISEVIILLI